MSFASPPERRYLSFVPSDPAILHMLAVAPLQTSLSSLNPYRSTSSSLGVCSILSSLLPRLLCRFQVRDDKELISLDQGYIRNNGFSVLGRRIVVQLRFYYYVCVFPKILLFER